MSFTDRSLKCLDCGSTFTFAAEEQEFYETRGFVNEPKRCPSCRQAKKTLRGGNSVGRRQMYAAVCAQCGKNTEVPFEPRNSRPVYCSNCYSKSTSNRY